VSQMVRTHPCPRFSSRTPGRNEGKRSNSRCNNPSSLSKFAPDTVPDRPTSALRSAALRLSVSTPLQLTVLLLSHPSILLACDFLGVTIRSLHRWVELVSKVPDFEHRARGWSVQYLPHRVDNLRSCKIRSHYPTIGCI